MTLLHVAKWVAGLGCAGLVLLMVSFFVADRELNPPFEAAELGPLEVPIGEQLGDDMLVFDSDVTGNFELYTTDREGAEPVRLTTDTGYDSWRPRISPDRRTILFSRSPAGTHDVDQAQASLWMIAASGGEPVEVLPPGAHGWREQGHAEWSPRGDELVMMGARPSGRQVWITSVDARDIRNVANAAGDNTDPSWSPDGKRIIYVACPETPCEPADHEVFVVLSVGGERTRLTNDELRDRDPHFSPDGRQIVFQTETVPATENSAAIWDLRVMPTNRTEPPRSLMAAAAGTPASPQWLDNETIVVGLDGDLYLAATSDGSRSVLVQSAGFDEYPSP